jgi:hypothetical protein
MGWWSNLISLKIDFFVDLEYILIKKKFKRDNT